MTVPDRQRLVSELSQLLSARLLWVLLPARHALSIQGKGSVAEVVSWAASNVAEDVASILERYEVRKMRNER